MKGMGLVLAAMLAGCASIDDGRQEREQASAQAANQLFEAAMKEIRLGAGSGKLGAAADRYARALEGIRQLVKQHPESNIARKVMAPEKLFLGMTLHQLEGHVMALRERERDVTVTLPPASPAVPLKGNQRPLVINIRKDGSYVAKGQPMDLGQIQQLLEEAARDDPRLKVLVRADGEVQFKSVATVLGAAKAAGFPQANIAFMLRP
ncbi:MAG: hypothetical protein CMO74_09985 [Verrucomicrobiales bacterium]|nr:hypothetical protein [Verrucomicrobiales bacterium]|tara:strand:- start:2041 stop:2661 length:621 start_codon:yes stop_codon:yes gene_type:complete